MVCIGTYNKSTRKGINKKGLNIIWCLVGGDDGGQHWGSLFPSKDWSWLGSDGSGMDGMGDYRGGMGDYRGGVGDHVGRRRGIGFLVSHTLVLHVSDEPVLVVRVIGHNLHPTVRKLDAVFSLDNTMIVLGLGLGKVAAIGISATILVCEGLGRDLLVDYMVDRGGIWGRGVWGRGSVDERGGVGNRPMGNCWAKELRGSKGTAKGCQGNENLHGVFAL